MFVESTLVFLGLVKDGLDRQIRDTRHTVISSPPAAATDCCSDDPTQTNDLLERDDDSDVGL